MPAKPNISWPRRMALMAAAAAAALTVVVMRRPLGDSDDDDDRRPWSCTCGQAYLVSGIDRHRVYWLLDDPLLARECVSCGAELPAGHDTAPADVALGR